MNFRAVRVFASITTLSLLLSAQAYSAPQDEGSWGAVFDWPLPPKHSVLTPEGNVLTIGTWGTLGAEGTRYFFDSWNPKLGTGTSSHTWMANSIPSSELNGQAAIIPGTGDVLITGARADGDFAEYQNYIFSTETNLLREAASITSFQTSSDLLVLASGELMVHPATGFQTTAQNPPVVYSPTADQWRSIPGAATPGVYSNSMTQWVKPNGKVSSWVSGAGGGEASLDLTGNGNVTVFSNTSGSNAIQVMYRPGKVLRAGAFEGDGQVLTLNDGVASEVRNVSERSYDVRNSNRRMIMLPNGKVLGQVVLTNSADKDSLEIWDPETEIWSAMAPTAPSATFARLNSMTLLKDGTVLSSGINYSGDNGGSSNAAEIFSPPYLFNASGELAERPEIISAPVKGSYGNFIAVEHAEGNVIKRATLLRTGRTDAGVSVGERFIELEFSENSDGFGVKLPDSANTAPPGYYMMFLLNEDGVPSEGHIIDLGLSSVSDAYPTATADEVTVTGGETVTIDALANDTGNGLVLNAPNAWSLEGGNVALLNNKITYTPKSGFNGVDKIWYVFSDTAGRTNSAVITITVSENGVESPYPSAQQDDVTTPAETAITIDVLANDHGEGLVLFPTNEWSLNGGTVTGVDNKLLYTPKAGFIGSDNIWYVFEDSKGRVNSGQVNITVTSATAFPVANPDYYTTTKNTGITLDILANDTASGGIAIDTLYAYTALGGTTVKSNGKVFYQPKADFLGEDNFWYVMIDAEGRKNSAKVIINVK